MRGRIRLTVSKETPTSTGPLRADGSVDYVAALNELYGAGVTADNNGAPAILPRVSVHPDTDPRVMRRMLSEIEALRAFPPPSEPIGRLERAVYLDGVGQLAFRGEWEEVKRDGVSFPVEPQVRNYVRNYVEWDDLLRRINRRFDVVIDCEDAPTAEARRVACRERDLLLEERSPSDLATAAVVRALGGARRPRSSL